MINITSTLEELYAKGYTGGEGIILYWLRKGKSWQEIIDICLQNVDSDRAIKLTLKKSNSKQISNMT